MSETASTAGSSDPRDYLSFGWHLCAIEPGSKGPQTQGWNWLRNAIRQESQLAGVHGVGLLHTFSGTMALDIDDMDLARTWLAVRGIDLDALLEAADAVRVSSGRPGRAKLLYRLRSPLRSLALRGSGLELRCATRDGMSVQDALPPTIHPKTNAPYEWVLGFAADLANLPEIPAALLALWQSLLDKPEAGSAAPIEAPALSIEQARARLANIDPDCEYPTWIGVGMDLRTALGQELGFTEWLEWSRKGAKFASVKDLQSHWRSFPAKVNPGPLHGTTAAPASPDDFEVVEPRPQLDMFGVPRTAGVSFTHVGDLKTRAAEYVVDGLLEQFALALIFGDPGCGKSFLAVDLACCIATGRPFHGHEIKRKGPVFIIVGEGLNGLKRRFDAWRKANGVDEQPDVFLSDGPVHLNDVNAVRDLVEVIRRMAAEHGEPALVIVDTVARNFGGGDENSTKDMNTFVAACDAIKKFLKTTLTLVHHTGHTHKDRARGALALKGALDTEIRLEASPGNDGKVVRAFCTKQKDGPEFDPLQFRFQEIAVSEEISSVVLVREKFKLGGADAEPTLVDETLDPVASNTYVRLALRALRDGPLTQAELREAIERLSDPDKPSDPDKLKKWQGLQRSSWSKLRRSVDEGKGKGANAFVVRIDPGYKPGTADDEAAIYWGARDARRARVAQEAASELFPSESGKAVSFEDALDLIRKATRLSEPFVRAGLQKAVEAGAVTLQDESGSPESPDGTPDGQGAL